MKMRFRDRIRLAFNVLTTKYLCEYTILGFELHQWRYWRYDQTYRACIDCNRFEVLIDTKIKDTSEILCDWEWMDKVRPFNNSINTFDRKAYDLKLLELSKIELSEPDDVICSCGNINIPNCCPIIELKGNTEIPIESSDIQYPFDDVYGEGSISNVVLGGDPYCKCSLDWGVSQNCRCNNLGWGQDTTRDNVNNTEQPTKRLNMPFRWYKDIRFK